MRNDLIGRVFAHAGKVVQSRSSTLVPLQWIILIFVLFLLLFVIAKAPSWLEIGLFVLLASAVLLCCIAYFYFMLKNPDALRSERHALSKYAIDKGLYGDSDSGMREVPRLGSEFPLLGAGEKGAASRGPNASRRPG